MSISKLAYIGFPADPIVYIDIIESNIHNYFQCETPWGDGETAFGAGGGFYWNENKLYNEEQLAYDIPPQMSWRALTDIVELSFQCHDAACLHIYYNSDLISYNSTVTLTLFKNDIIQFIYDDPTNTYSSQDEVCISNIKITIKNDNQGSVAHHVPTIYIGSLTEVPIYEEGMIQITEENCERYFDASTSGDAENETGCFVWDGNTLVNQMPFFDLGATLYLTALADISKITFDCQVLDQNGTLIVQCYDTLGNSSYDRWIYSDDGIVSIELTMPCNYTLYFDAYDNNEVGGNVIIYNIKISDLVLNGYEVRDAARKVVKAYLGNSNNVATLWYDTPLYLKDFKYKDNYNGTYTVTEWNHTLNKEYSRRLVLPDVDSIIL